MTTPPPNPCIYHITHVENLARIVASNGLFSDAVMLAHGGPSETIGMSDIKTRRLSLPIRCHPGLHVGDCVPFYFCPRSIMLYVLHCRNSPDLTYQGGQEPIVHLEADLYAVVHWATTQGRRWGFSLSNAGAGYAQFRNSLANLGDIDWDAITSNNFGGRSITPSGLLVKEGKQSEFLLEHHFPWHLVRRIGVHSRVVALQARAAVQHPTHPPISVQPRWYF